MHQTVGNMLQTLLHSNLPQNLTHARDIADQVLATEMHDMQVKVATTLGSMPGALTFRCDMFFNILLIVNW